MNIEEYRKVVQELTDDRKEVSKGKRKDYTRSSDNVLQNFHNQAEALDITPMKSLAVHLEKQIAAVFNYIKTDGQSESEPIIKRLGDSINYLELLWGLIKEKGLEEKWDELEDFEVDEPLYDYDSDLIDEDLEFTSTTRYTVDEYLESLKNKEYEDVTEQKSKYKTFIYYDLVGKVTVKFLATKDEYISTDEGAYVFTKGDTHEYKVGDQTYVVKYVGDPDVVSIDE